MLSKTGAIASHVEIVLQYPEPVSMQTQGSSEVWGMPHGVLEDHQWH